MLNTFKQLASGFVKWNTAHRKKCFMREIRLVIMLTIYLTVFDIIIQE